MHINEKKIVSKKGYFGLNLMIKSKRVYLE